MDLSFGSEELAFRDEVRAFLKQKLTPELQQAGRSCTGIYCDYPVANHWFRILAGQGWSVPHWPVEYGGTGWTPAQHLIFKRELAAAGAPRVTPNATNMVGPVIIEFGTEEQKRTLLPRIRSGDDWWAQGYSEPEAGSDLASLRLSAVRQGDHFVLNGSKIWTTHAHFSNRMFCLVRTGRSDKPQVGISFLLLDLDLPGIRIRPIISISGEHELNEVFFEDVRVPADGLLGAENDGWTVAKYLLQHERSSTWTPLLRARLDQMKTAPGPADGTISKRMIRAEMRIAALEVSELRALFAKSDGPPDGLAASMSKICGTELRQELTELAVALDGRAAMAHPVHSADRGNAVATYLNDRAASIYAGTNEVQRDIVAKFLFR